DRGPLPIDSAMRVAHHAAILDVARNTRRATAALTWRSRLMSWIRDPRPGIAWRTKRLRNRAKRRIKRERRRLPEPIGRLTYRDKGLRFRSKWGAAWYDRPLQEHLVLYESFGGNGALCSPRAVFDELLHLPDMRHLRHVWCFNNIAVKRDFDAQFATHPRVRSV